MRDLGNFANFADKSRSCERILIKFFWAVRSLTGKNLSVLVMIRIQELFHNGIFTSVGYITLHYIKVI